MDVWSCCPHQRYSFNIKEMELSSSRSIEQCKTYHLIRPPVKGWERGKHYFNGFEPDLCDVRFFLHSCELVIDGDWTSIHKMTNCGKQIVQVCYDPELNGCLIYFLRRGVPAKAHCFEKVPVVNLNHKFGVDWASIATQSNNPVTRSF